MSSFIQYQTKELVDYSKGTRRGGGGGGGGVVGVGTLDWKLRKTTIGLLINSLLINFLEFTGSDQQTEIPCF